MGKKNKNFCKDCLWFSENHFPDSDSGICVSPHAELHRFDPIRTNESTPNEAGCFKQVFEAEKEIFWGSSFKKIIQNYFRIHRLSENKALE